MERLKIEGMRCGNCTSSVTKALEAIEGISNVKVDLDNKEAQFDNSGVDKDTLKNTIEALGFDVVE